MSSEFMLQQVKKVRISDTVVDQILSLIENGQLNVGDQLPGERDLVSQLGVGRASVREALRILEAQGLVEVRPGIGTFITDDVATGDEAILQWFQQHADEVLHMVEVREALDRQAAMLAAGRISATQIAELHKNIEQQFACLHEKDTEQLVQLDHKFHHLIAEASGNELLMQLITSIIEAMINPRRSVLHTAGRAEESVQQHRAIVLAIESGDPQSAEVAVQNHIDSVRSAILMLRDKKTRKTSD